MRARSGSARDMKVYRCVADLALLVSLFYPLVDLPEICIANANLNEASFQALPVPGITPESTSVAPQHFIHAVAKQIPAVFGRNHCLIGRNHLPIYVCKLWHDAP